MDLWLLVGVRAPQCLTNPQGVRRPARLVDPLLGPEPLDEATKAWTIDHQPVVRSKPQELATKLRILHGVERIAHLRSDPESWPSPRSFLIPSSRKSLDHVTHCCTPCRLRCPPIWRCAPRARRNRPVYSRKV